MIGNTLLERIESDVKIRPFIRKIKSYDENLYVHSTNVAYLTECIIDALGFPIRSKWDIVTGALLHDIGKTFLPFDLINKPSYLTGAEMAIVKNHPGIGYNLLKDFELGPVALDIVLHHHEDEIGEGYPHGSTDMFLETKIVSVCDKYEAIRSDRPYKKGYTHEQTMQALDYMFNRYTDIEDIKAIINSFENLQLAEGM